MKNLKEFKMTQSIDGMDFSAPTRKTLRKNGVFEIADLVMLTGMPCWGSRLLRCGRQTAWEIIMRMSHDRPEDLNVLVQSSGFRYTDQEISHCQKAA